MKYIIITKKKWHKKNFEKLNKNYIVLNKINHTLIKKTQPKIIFFIFWSKMVPLKFLSRYLCIQFHTSNLPKFRGGSPIQNQIVKGITKTRYL